MSSGASRASGRTTSPEPTTAQREALGHAEARAARLEPDARVRIQAALADAGVPAATYAAATRRLESEARVALAFHPDRLSRGGRTVARGLLADGVYRNQFETGVSSGGTSAWAGGARDEWERRLFGGAYHGPGAEWHERPKYGALFLAGHADGPCPRFGSCYLVLRPEVSSRCSFTLGSSHEAAAPERSGTLAAFAPVMAALASHLESTPAPLGVPGLTLARLLQGMANGLPFPPDPPPAHGLGRALDSFVEAQVHGTVELARDVEEIVADRSFDGTASGDALAELATRHGIPWRWHPGFRLRAEDFPDEFRGFPAGPVARRVAVDGVVDAAILGAGENAFVQDPGSWRELGSRSDVLTSFRRVWHVLVLEGRPVGDRRMAAG